MRSAKILSRLAFLTRGVRRALRYTSFAAVQWTPSPRESGTRGPPAAYRRAPHPFRRRPPPRGGGVPGADNHRPPSRAAPGATQRRRRRVRRPADGAPRAGGLTDQAASALVGNALPRHRTGHERDDRGPGRARETGDLGPRLRERRRRARAGPLADPSRGPGVRRTAGVPGQGARAPYRAHRAAADGPRRADCADRDAAPSVHRAARARGRLESSRRRALRLAAGRRRADLRPPARARRLAWQAGPRGRGDAGARSAAPGARRREAERAADALLHRRRGRRADRAAGTRRRASATTGRRAISLRGTTGAAVAATTAASPGGGPGAGDAARARHAGRAAGQ